MVVPQPTAVHIRPSSGVCVDRGMALKLAEVLKGASIYNKQKKKEFKRAPLFCTVEVTSLPVLWRCHCPLIQRQNLGA